MNRKFLLLLVFILALPLSAVNAQLDDEQQELFDRAASAILASREYTSYTATESTVQTNNIVVYVDGEAVDTREESIVFSGEFTVVEGNASLILNVVGTETRNEEESSYLFDGEVRLVDGVVYAEAEHLVPGGENLPTLPGAEFVEVASEDEYTGLEDVSISRFFESIEEERPFLLFDIGEEELALINEYALTVGVVDDLVNDQPVQLISILVSPEGLLALIQDEAEEDGEELEPAVLALLENSDDAGIALGVYLDENDQLVQLSVTNYISLTGAPASIVAPDAPENTTLDTTQSEIGVITFQNINTELEPITAPE